MIENKAYNTVTEKVTHRVYMRDWYYNAGIAGFLYILLDGKRPTEIPGLTIGDNYIEFESKALQGFEEKFRRKSFSYFFKLELFFHRIDSNIKEIEEALKTTKNKRGEKTAYFYDKMEKFPFKGFLNLFSNRLKNIINLDDFCVSFSNVFEVYPERFFSNSKCNLLAETKAISIPEKKADNTIEVIIIRISASIF